MSHIDNGKQIYENVIFAASIKNRFGLLKSSPTMHKVNQHVISPHLHYGYCILDTVNLLLSGICVLPTSEIHTFHLTLFPSRILNYIQFSSPTGTECPSTASCWLSPEVPERQWANLLSPNPGTMGCNRYNQIQPSATCPVPPRLLAGDPNVRPWWKPMEPTSGGGTWSCQVTGGAKKRCM